VVHFVILGAGECGARAAFALREKGFAGEITLVGAEPLPPYERPPLSKAGPADASDPKFIAAAEKYIENGIRLLTGVEARDLDTASRTVTLSDGNVLSYDKLLLATGAAARSFPGAQEGSRQTPDASKSAGHGVNLPKLCQCCLAVHFAGKDFP
jgi:3-phenylpropionate/trans-cinnamate dioxygenase ferredoxin reductase subunit